MLILFLKSRPTDADDEMPLTEKLRRVLMLKVEEAQTDRDRERAERELRKFDIHNERLLLIWRAVEEFSRGDKANIGSARCGRQNDRISVQRFVRLTGINNDQGRTVAIGPDRASSGQNSNRDSQNERYGYSRLISRTAISNSNTTTRGFRLTCFIPPFTGNSHRFNS